MRFLVVILILFLWPGWTDAHPLHLSVTNITLENGKLKVSMKTFRDDWEVAYFHYHSKVIDFNEQENREIAWFGKYLADHFNIKLSEDGDPLDPVLDQIFMDEDGISKEAFAMTIEMHFQLSDTANSLYIYNTLLTDIYPDQTNLVIFGFKNKETGIKFDNKKVSAQVKLK
jgi:hypothetical protein